MAIKFKEMAYQSTGYVLTLGGIGLGFYGLATNDWRSVSEGFIAACGGNALIMRSNYTSKRIHALEGRVAQLEQIVTKN